MHRYSLGKASNLVRGLQATKATSTSLWCSLEALTVLVTPLGSSANQHGHQSLAGGQAGGGSSTAGLAPQRPCSKACSSRDLASSTSSLRIKAASAAAFGCSWLRHHGSWTQPPDLQPHREEQQQQQQHTEQLDELSGSSSDDEAAEQQHLEPSAAAPGAAGEQSMLTVGGPAAHEVAAAVKLLQSRAGLTAEEAEHVLYMATHFSSPRAHRAPRKHPRFISCDDEVRPVVDWLLALPGLNIHTCLTRSPHILVDSPIARLDSNSRRLTERLVLQPRELGRLVSRNPFVLQEDLSKRLFPVFDFLGSLGLSVDQQRGIALKSSIALNFSLSKVQQRVQWLRDVGLSDAQLRLVLWKHFRIVCMGREAAQRGLDWVLEQGVPRDKLPVVLTRLPGVISYGADKRHQFLEFLRSELGLPQETVAKLLVQVPDTLGRTIDKLRHNVEIMRSVVGFTDAEQIRRLVHGNPGVLRLDLSSSTYRAKLQFAKEELKVEDVCELLLTHPFFINYRLDRIASRGCYLKSLDRSTSSPTSWLSAGDVKFCEVHARTTMLEYQSWLQDWRQTAKGVYWLKEAAGRQHNMSGPRLAQDAEADSAAQLVVQGALADEAAAAGLANQRFEAAKQLLQQELGPDDEHLRGSAAQALAQAERRGRDAMRREQAAQDLIREQQAAAGEGT